MLVFRVGCGMLKGERVLIFCNYKGKNKVSVENVRYWVKSLYIVFRE